MRRREEVDAEAAHTVRRTPELVLASLRPPEDNLVSKLYAAVLALEGGARNLDVADLRPSVDAFVRDVDAIAYPIPRRRFAALAGKLGPVVDALELGDADSASGALADGLSAFALA